MTGLGKLRSTVMVHWVRVLGRKEKELEFESAAST